MHVGFTGTQRGMSVNQLRAVKAILAVISLVDDHDQQYLRFHHGDCIGADAQAHDIAVAEGYIPIIHPPIDDKKRAFCEALRPQNIRNPKPYLERNHDIVDDCSLLIATPGEVTEQLRSGTWATIRYARKIGRALAIIYPDGSLE